MPISLAGKTAIVTGAGRGIGKAVAEVFAREGARVLVVNRSPEAGQAATDGIGAEGFEASFLQADVRKKADMERMAATCIARYGRIDILCLNAGIYPNALIADMTEAMWDDVMDTNLKGVFFAAQACLPQMKSQRAGRLLLVSSITGPRVGLPDVSCYMASKGGVNAFVRGAALELAPYNITANTVSPGSILTEGIAQARGDGGREGVQPGDPRRPPGRPGGRGLRAGLPRLGPGPLRHRPRHRTRRRPDPAGEAAGVLSGRPPLRRRLVAVAIPGYITGNMLEVGRERLVSKTRHRQVPAPAGRTRLGPLRGARAGRRSRAYPFPGEAACRGRSAG